MTDALFTEAEVWVGDPLRPDYGDSVQPTPLAIVHALSAADRRRRVAHLIEQADLIITDAIDAHLGTRSIAAAAVLYSGGNDSTILAHLMTVVMPNVGGHRATHAIHANTTIGIEQTRQFVRDTCAAWGLPLIEKVAPVSYRDLVLAEGFPGPGMHWKMYSRLKERCLDAARHDLGVANSRTKAALFYAGRRRQESARRADVVLHESDGSVIWASPLAMWTSADMNTYRQMHPDVPRNPVSDLIHMSGECLCGAFAHKGELDELGYWFPEVRAEIEALQADVAAAGHGEPLCRWGHGEGVPSRLGRLCGSCTAPDQPTLEFGGAA